MKIQRKIIEIDQKLCNGCGLCIIDCAEKAITIENSKAKVISDIMCDGLGACIGACPMNALKIIEREALPFDESFCPSSHSQTAEKVMHKCLSTEPLYNDLTRPFSSMREGICANPGITPQHSATSKHEQTSGGWACKELIAREVTGIMNWPVKLRLAQPRSNLFTNNGPVEILLLADCVPAVLPDFYEKYGKGCYVYTACSKFEDTGEIALQFSNILRAANPTSVTVMRVNVPCCQGLFTSARGAVNMSGKQIDLKGITIGKGGTEEFSEILNGLPGF